MNTASLKVASLLSLCLAACTLNVASPGEGLPPAEPDLKGDAGSTTNPPTNKPTAPADSGTTDSGTGTKPAPDGGSTSVNDPEAGPSYGDASSPAVGVACAGTLVMSPTASWTYSYDAVAYQACASVTAKGTSTYCAPCDLQESDQSQCLVTVTVSNAVETVWGTWAFQFNPETATVSIVASDTDPSVSPMSWSPTCNN